MTRGYDFGRQRAAWRNVPVDDVGYMDAAGLLRLPDDELKRLALAFEKTRYDPAGVRNWRNRWRAYLGLDSTSGKRVLDFGCGFGIEAVQFAKAGNEIILADVNGETLDLAERILGLFGHKPLEKFLADGTRSRHLRHAVDVFYANGVLHHIPFFRETLEWGSRQLRPGGCEFRLMLYSDVAWRDVVGDLPGVDVDVTRHSGFSRFVRTMDSVGDYADWYNREKIERKVGDFLEVASCHYLRRDRWYLAAILKVI